MSLRASLHVCLTCLICRHHLLCVHAGYYACLPYSAAQFLIEIPYLVCLSVYYVVIIYAMIGFDWEAGKFFW